MGEMGSGGRWMFVRVVAGVCGARVRAEGGVGGRACGAV